MAISSAWSAIAIKNKCYRYFLTCARLNKWLLVQPIFERSLPTKKKYQNPYTIYYIERFKVIGGGPEATSRIGKEWREMSAQDKLRYKEKYKEVYKEYEKECEIFYDSFPNEEEKKLYLNQLADYRRKRRAYLAGVRMQRMQQKIKSMEKASRKPRKYSAFLAMMKHQCQNIPKDNRVNYIMKQACIEYRNLTKEELEKYQKMADDITHQKMKEYQIRMEETSISEAYM